MRRSTRIEVRFIAGHLELSILSQMLRILLVVWLRERARVVGRTILQMCRSEVRRGVRKSACRYAVLVITVPTLPTHSRMVLMLIIYVVTLMRVTLVLEVLGHTHPEVLMSRAAIEQAMVLSMVAVVVHTIRVMRGGVCAR